jgi:hypothetical protein
MCGWTETLWDDRELISADTEGFIPSGAAVQFGDGGEWECRGTRAAKESICRQRPLAAAVVGSVHRPMLVQEPGGSGGRTEADG